MEFKRQTNRSTRQDKTTNINLFLKDFSFGIVTSKYWGNFEPRENPLIQIEIKGQNYEIPLSEFIKMIRPKLNKFKGFEEER